MHGTIEQAFRVEWRPLAELAVIAPEWRTLANAAAEPNVFYEPAFALAAQPVFGRGVGAGLVWSRETPGRLLGFFPARIERRRYGVPLPILAGWTHPFAPLGAPLVDREAAAAVITAWLDHVAGHNELPSVMLMPFVPTHGRFAEAMHAALVRRGGTSIPFASHQRAMLAPAGDRKTYLDRALSRHKRKVLRWQRRRLADIGAVSHGSTRDPDAIVDAFGDFLALEANGWKGRAGTAIRADADIRTFAEAALAELARDGRAQIDRLLVDTRAIAATVTLRSGDTAWLWKIAYDESFAKSSPGVQLVLDVTEGMLDDASLARTNSCAISDHPMIDHLWRERLPLADLLVRIGPEGGAKFAVAHGLETLRRAAIAGAKRLRGAMRR